MIFGWFGGAWSLQAPVTDGRIGHPKVDRLKVKTSRKAARKNRRR